MTSPRRYNDGVTNVGITDALHNLMTMAPTKVHLEFYDWNIYTAANWTVTESNAAATQALAAGDGGALLLTTSAAEDATCFIQKPIINFYMVAGKKMWYGVRFQSNDIDQVDIVGGLTTVDTSPIASAPADGCYFLTLDGSTDIAIYLRAGSAAVSSATAINIGAMSDATYYALEWYYDGEQAIEYFFNGTYVGELDATTIPSAGLSLNLGVVSGEKSANTMQCDWVYAAKER